MKAGKKNCSPWLQLIKLIVVGDSYTFWSIKSNISGINTYEKKINFQDNTTMQQT